MRLAGALQTLPFRTDRFVLIVPKGHALAGSAGLGFADVLGEEFVGLDRASALQRFLAGKAALEGRRLPLRVRLRSFDAVCRMVEAGVGVGIVPATTAYRTAQGMAVEVVPLHDAWTVRDLRICLRDLASLSVRARQLVEIMARPR